MRQNDRINGLKEGERRQVEGTLVEEEPFNDEELCAHGRGEVEWAKNGETDN